MAHMVRNINNFCVVVTITVIFLADVSSASNKDLHLEGHHVKNLGQSGRIIRDTTAENSKSNQRIQPVTEKCEAGDTGVSECRSQNSDFTKINQSIILPSASLIQFNFNEEPPHPGPLKLEIKSIKNSTSADFQIAEQSGRDIDISLSWVFSFIVSFAWKAITSFVFVKLATFFITGIWHHFCKWMGIEWDAEQYNHFDLNLGGNTRHPFEHYKYGWKAFGPTGPASFFPTNPKNSLHHHPSLSNYKTGNIYYKGNKYWSGSHADLKALKKGIKKGKYYRRKSEA